jgi:prolyl-tRNA synthetase
MTHSDDDGLILPPRIASKHVVIIPIIHSDEARSRILAACEKLSHELRAHTFDGRPIETHLDLRDLRGGEKAWSWIKKGVPIRIEVGARELDAGRLSLYRRDKPHKESFPFTPAEIPALLQEIQDSLYQRARSFRDAHTHRIDTLSDFTDFFSAKDEHEIHGGFALCHWNGDPAIEERLKKELNVTIRCIPSDSPLEPGRCPFSQESSPRRVLFAKAY